MEGNLSLLFLSFYFNSLIWHSADTLCKDFSELGSLAYLNQDIVTFLNQTEAEGRHTNLSNGSVVQDLTADVLHVNNLTNMGL